MRIQRTAKWGLVVCLLASHASLVMSQGEQSALLRAETQQAAPALETALRTLTPPAVGQTPPGAAPPKVGTAVPVVNVGLNELSRPLGSTTPPGAPPPRSASEWSRELEARFNRPHTQLYFPVDAPSDGVVVVRRVDNAWRASAWEGDGPLAKALNVTTSTPDPSADPKQSLGVMHVRGLNLAFMVEKVKEEVVLRPIWDAPKYGLRANETTPATKVFSLMQAEASKRVGDAPRETPPR